MTQFTTTKLVNQRVLVKGTDKFGTEGQTVLDASQWNELSVDKRFDAATKEFDAAVESFFAPLTEAADKVKAAHHQEPDPVGFVVLSEAVEGVAPQPARVRMLTPDSIVLRLLESGDGDRLAWINDNLEVLEVDDQAGTAGTPESGEVGDEAFVSADLDEV